MNWMLYILALLSGVVLAVQAAINGGLGKRIGAMEGAFVSFSVGTLALFVAVLVIGKGTFPSITGIPKFQLTGGLLGACYVAISVMIVPKLGVASALTAAIVGQLMMGSVIDHFALFGGKQIAFDMKRALALVLMGVGLYLFYKK
ncbi:DMT family transporter [Ectobacillus sp. sgz5001026]|uniref:DMT family transporter n=1 Tax=Ectobacillus sp. sgz5001026 TaxID=3242473 RepID=UPI0036D2ABD5